MDRYRDFADDGGGDDAPAIDTPAVIGTDERRMHVRAYNYWVSLLGGRAYPAVEDLDADNLDFGSNSVLLDFTQGAENPAIAWLGERLRTECGLEDAPETAADVPPRSLISRLTDHYLQIIANRAPIGFEAEFVSARGIATAYRGILLPFSSDDDTIDFIYGVINWKELAPATEAAAIEAELNAALHAPAAAASTRPAVAAWADGPHAADVDGDELGEADEIPAEPDGEGLADWLAAARASADLVKNADSRSRAALYGALGLAYDFALLAGGRDEEYAQLLADTGIKQQARAPMTPVVKLIFGADYDKTRLTEFAAALSFAKRRDLPKGGMRVFLEHFPGGLKAIVAAERRERRPVAERVERPDAARDAARVLPAQAVLTLPGDDEFVVLVARRLDAERVAIIGVAPDDQPLLSRALKHIVAP